MCACVCVCVCFVPLFRNHQDNGKHKQTLEIGKFTVTTKQRTKTPTNYSINWGLYFMKIKGVVSVWCPCGVEWAGNSTRL